MSKYDSSMHIRADERIHVKAATYDHPAFTSLRISSGEGQHTMFLADEAALFAFRDEVNDACASIGQQWQKAAVRILTVDGAVDADGDPLTAQALSDFIIAELDSARLEAIVTID